MHEAFIDVNNVPTHVMTWGDWIEADLSKQREIVLCIPGNPGLPGYYTRYLAELHYQLGKDIPVWIIGHAGHDEPASDKSINIPDLENNEHLFNLEGQVKHKVEFIKKYVPENTKIHLVGHSIGSWMILQLLKNSEVSKKILHTYLLFPTIERMAESSNGKLLINFLFPIRKILQFIVMLFCLLPIFVRTYLIYFYFILSSIPNWFLGTTLNYIQVSVLQKVLFLAKDEMDKVTELDVKAVQEHQSRMKLYYGATDGWTPLEYYKELKDKFPNIDAQVCKWNYAHAFVLKSSGEMAVLTAEWILSKTSYE